MQNSVSYVRVRDDQKIEGDLTFQAELTWLGTAEIRQDRHLLHVN